MRRLTLSAAVQPKNEKTRKVCLLPEPEGAPAALYDGASFAGMVLESPKCA